MEVGVFWEKEVIEVRKHSKHFFSNIQFVGIVYRWIREQFEFRTDANV